MSRFLRLFGASLAFSQIISAASAQQNGDETETVVVTATRTEQPAARTGESISVLSAEDIASQQIDFVGDALAEAPGMAVVRYGGVGQLTTLGIRGAEAGQTLVLVDGVPINDPSSTDDEALLGDVLVNDIDRIEVLRGPQSTLYGSDAIGGVIDILTRRGGAAPAFIVATAEGGSFGTAHLNLAANGTEGALEYGAGANLYHTDGTPAADPRNGNVRNDRYGELGLTENARLHLDDRMSIDLRTYFTDARYDFDNNYPPPLYLIADSTDYGTNLLAAGYLGLNVDLLSGRFRNRIALSGSDSERKTFPDGGEPADFFALGGAARLEYQGILDVDQNNQATFGAETQTTTLATHSIYDSTSRTKGADRIDSLYGQYQSTLGELTLTGGLRFDHDHAFGNHISVKAAGAWSLFEGATVLHANFGDGFKAPTLYELYSEYSNPVAPLRPETAQGWEAGADQSVLSGSIRVSATYFSRLTTNQIDFYDCFGPGSGPGCPSRYLVGGYYYNIGRTRADGVELAAVANPTDTLTARISYTNLSAKDLVDDTDLPLRPQLAADATLTWRPDPDVSLGGNLGFVGKRWGDTANTMRLSGDTLVNLFATYALTDRLSIFGRIENALDLRYEPQIGYGAPGRAFYAGLRASE